MFYYCRLPEQVLSVFNFFLIRRINWTTAKAFANLKTVGTMDSCLHRLETDNCMLIFTGLLNDNKIDALVQD